MGYFKVTAQAAAQIFLLGAIGYFLVKKAILSDEGLNALSRLIIEVTLPVLIFYQLVKGFTFALYPRWWAFPLLSLGITGLALILGFLFTGFIKGKKKAQFLSLIAFQNSGYLPLVLLTALLPPDKLEVMFIYIFLFLLGFNLIIWSMGVSMLIFNRVKRFELASLFSPPVIATIFSLIFIYFNFNEFIPQALYRPLKMAGDCTLPLAMFVVGGNLAQVNLERIDKKAIFFMALIKLVLLPLLGLCIALKFRLPELVGLLLLIELAMPPATSLSVITRHYKGEDLLISQGVFFGHLISLITLPIFLSLYFMLSIVK